MEWYQVTKTIKDRKYLYWQKTYRCGGSVKTLNKYIGPGANPPRMPSLAAVMQGKPERHQRLRKDYDAGRITKTQYLEALADKPRDDEPQIFASVNVEYGVSSDNPEPGNPEGEQDDLRGTVPPQADRFLAPFTPEEAKAFIGPSTSMLTGKDKRDYERAATRERKEDERVQYGPLKPRIERHAAELRAAKRRAKGAKATNPYLAVLLRKDKPAAPQPSEFVQYHMGLMRRGATGPGILSPHQQIEDTKVKTKQFTCEMCGKDRISEKKRCHECDHTTANGK